MSAAIGNLYALGNHGGRPPKYETPDQLEREVIAYFEWAQENKVKLTVTGLALYLGFADKNSLYDYRDKEEFFHPIKRSLTIIENAYEQNLNTKYSTGAIFALKNFGWKDKQEHEHSGDMSITMDLKGNAYED